MAHKLASLSILFLLLLLAFSPVLGEHQGSKEADVNQFNDDKHHGGCHPCRHGCCSAEEYAEFLNKKAAADIFYPFPRCRYNCRHRCCSAAEFAEFTKQAAGQH